MTLSHKERSQKFRHVTELFHCHDAITMLLFFRDRDETHAPVCTNPACIHVSMDIDRLEEHGHCPECHTNTVESVLVMVGVV